MSFRQLSSGRKPGSDGLPHEFFSQFWEVLGPELLAVLQEAFQAQHGLSLPASMTRGVITLLYKGKGSKALVKVRCQLLTVLSLICIVWHTVCSVEMVARRRVRLPSCVLFFGEKVLCQFGRSWESHNRNKGTTACRAVAPELGCHTGLVVM